MTVKTSEDKKMVITSLTWAINSVSSLCARMPVLYGALLSTDMKVLSAAFSGRQKKKNMRPTDQQRLTESFMSCAPKKIRNARNSKLFPSLIDKAL